MTAYGLSGYLVRAHQAHLLREAAMAHGTRSGGRVENPASVVQRVLARVRPFK